MSKFDIGLLKQRTVSVLMYDLMILAYWWGRSKSNTSLKPVAKKYFE